MNKRKFKGTNISVTESLTSLRMTKLKDARDEYGFSKVWTSDGRIMVMEEGSWINDCVAFYIMEKDIVFWGFYFNYFMVIMLGHNRVFKGKNFTMLFVYFLRSFSKWECAFKKYCLFIFLIFLITKKIISTSLLSFLIINFAIILYFKTFIKFKSNYQRSLKLPKQNESY